MKHNPFKPDPKLPWCRKCRAHTPCRKEPVVSFGSRVLRSYYWCKVCNAQAFSLFALRKFNCIWWVITALAVLVGTGVYFSGADHDHTAEEHHEVGTFILGMVALPCFCMAIWLFTRLFWQNRWAKRQELKGEEGMEAQRRVYLRSVVPYAGENPWKN
jgi:uncharacterized membrane protein